MANRLPQNAALHDRVIQAAASRLDSSNYDIYTNPGSSKLNGVGDNYPDIILTPKGDRTVQFIIEVETSDSITLTEASQQWKKYAAEIKASFYRVARSTERWHELSGVEGSSYGEVG